MTIIEILYIERPLPELPVSPYVRESLERAATLTEKAAREARARAFRGEHDRGEAPCCGK